jgi:hypothetical protein
MWRETLILGALAGALGACGGAEPERAAASAFEPPPLPGVYAGTFPCANCLGIDTRLWLRADQRFFIRQHYREETDDPAPDAYGLGRWSWDTAKGHLVLSGAGPVRTFARDGASGLKLLTSSEIEHRLEREPVTSDFTDLFRFEGIVVASGDSASLAECLTGLTAPIEHAGAYRSFIREYRSLIGYDQPALVAVEGRFNWGENGLPESIVLAEVITVKPDRNC